MDVNSDTTPTGSGSGAQPPNPSTNRLDNGGDGMNAVSKAKLLRTGFAKNILDNRDHFNDNKLATSQSTPSFGRSMGSGGTKPNDGPSNGNPLDFEEILTPLMDM